MKPMLGITIDRSELEARLAAGPLLGSFKLDGVRALVRDGIVLSRSLKPIPNQHVQKLFGRTEFEGFDGELVVGHAYDKNVYRTTVSGVMSEDSEPDVNYFVFDRWDQPTMPLHQRAHELKHRFFLEGLGRQRIQMVWQHTLRTMQEVDEKFQDALLVGYEGLVLRNPLGLYKYGRSTVKEAGLLKIKPFVDADAEVIGIVEQMHNGNEAFKNELGRTARSTAKAGKIGMHVLGALVCRTPEGIEFEIGTGFSAAERQMLWTTCPIGKTVKYKFLKVGGYDKPRSPVFLGFRDRRDT